MTSDVYHTQSTGCDGILGSGKVLDECNRCLAPNVGDGRCVRFLGSIGGTQIATHKQDGKHIHHWHVRWNMSVAKYLRLLWDKEYV